MARNILVIHGPNLNLLGTREPHIYGAQTLDDINRHLVQLATELDSTCQTYQSNSEGQLVDRIQAAAQQQELLW